MIRYLLNNIMTDNNYELVICEPPMESYEDYVNNLDEEIKALDNFIKMLHGANVQIKEIVFKKHKK